MDLLKVWSVWGGLPLRERAKQRQAYRHQELRRWREFLGIPTYVFEGELFWGQDRLQMPEWRLTQKLGSPKGAPPKG
jgi:2-hydroxychromene-2-carboxylate isomerase